MGVLEIMCPATRTTIYNMARHTNVRFAVNISRNKTQILEPTNQEVGPRIRILLREIFTVRLHQIQSFWSWKVRGDFKECYGYVKFWAYHQKSSTVWKARHGRPFLAISENRPKISKTMYASYVSNILTDMTGVTWHAWQTDVEHGWFVSPFANRKTGTPFHTFTKVEFWGRKPKLGCHIYLCRYVIIFLFYY